MDVQLIVAALQDALGVKVPCGQITLNMNESQVDSVETKVKLRVRTLDKGHARSASLTHASDSRP